MPIRTVRIIGCACRESTRHRWRLVLNLFWLWFFLLGGAAPALAQETGAAQYAILGDANVGRQVYADKHCGQCHAINGVGPGIGPDLARSPSRAQTVTQIAGAMWNHAPVMREVSREKGVQWSAFRGSEMQDLIAYLAFLRLLDQPGNPDRGRRLFVEKGCSACHGLADDGRRIGPDLARWDRLGSPVLWAEIMWQHANQMEARMREMRLGWPAFRENELVDLIAFVRTQTSAR